LEIHKVKKVLFDGYKAVSGYFTADWIVAGQRQLELYSLSDSGIIRFSVTHGSHGFNRSN